MNKIELITLIKNYSNLGGCGNDLTEEEFAFAEENAKLVYEDQDAEGKVVTHTEVYRVGDTYIMVWRDESNVGYWNDSEWLGEANAGECMPIERVHVDYVLTRGI